MMDQHFFSGDIFRAFIAFLGLSVFIPMVTEGNENLSIKRRSNSPAERTKYFFAHHQSYLWCFTWIPFIKWILQLQHHSNISIDKNGKYIFTNDHNSIKALPTLEDLLACHARSKACLSCRRLSSRWRAACRRCAAALAPGPSWLSLSSRQSELAFKALILKGSLCLLLYIYHMWYDI